MEDDADWKLNTEAHLAALQFMVASMFQQHYFASGASDDWIAEQHQKIRDMFAKYSVGGADPAMADHASSYLSEHISNILTDIDDIVARYRSINPRTPEYKFPDNPIDFDYRIFPLEIEQDPNILFHGTSAENYAPITEQGFKSAHTLGRNNGLKSVSFAPSSNLALAHWCRVRKPAEDGIVIAVRYEDTSHLSGDSTALYAYNLEPQPKIIGFCRVPHTYVFV